MAATTSGPRVAPLLRNLALLSASVIVCSACLELGLRATHLFGARVSWATPDPVLGYRFVPGAAYWSIQESNHPISGSINRFGWRDREWSVTKQAGSYRIAILGDSFVEAMQVEADSTFLALAEAALTSATGHPVELMNFGRSGYTQSEELLVLEREVLRFAPDMVVLCFFPGNDIADIDRVTSSGLQRPFFVPSTAGLVLDTSFAASMTYVIRSDLDLVKRHSIVVSLLSERYSAWQLSQRSAAGRGLDGYLSLCTRDPIPTYVQNYGLNKRLMQKMASILAGRGIRFGIMALPLPAYMPSMNRRFSALDATFDPNYYDKDLATFGAANDVAILGLETTFGEAYRMEGPPLNWQNVGHWTYAGHRVVAGALTSWLRPIVAGHFARPAQGAETGAVNRRESASAHSARTSSMRSW